VDSREAVDAGAEHSGHAENGHHGDDHD